jgi:hypothetical protein
MRFAKGAAWQMADELKRAWGRLLVHAQVAQQPGYGGYLGVEAAMAGGGCERKFQHALSGRTHGKQLKWFLSHYQSHGSRRPDQ